MPPEAGARLSAKQALGLHVMYERTRPGGEWLTAGKYGVRSNTMFALERKGLVRTRLYLLHEGVTGSGYEGQITQAGQAWIEQHPAE